MPRRASKPRTDEPRYLLFAHELERLAKRSNMNQTELAAASGVSASYISKLYDGYQKPRMEKLERLVSALEHADFGKLARLAGINVPYVVDTTYLPGWDMLNEDEQGYVRGIVKRMAKVNEVAGQAPEEPPAPPPSLPPREEGQSDGQPEPDQEPPTTL